MTPKIAIAPATTDAFEAAVIRGGGEISAPESADGLVWSLPTDPHGLKTLLKSSPARWVQLPFAGIESFIEAGAVDPDRTWTCTKVVYGHACAEHAVALMLAAARQLRKHLRANTWRSPGLGSPERRLAGSTILIVGAGGIGRELAVMLEPFEVRVTAVNRSGTPVPGAYRTETTEALGELVPEADFVVLTAALTADTRGMIDAEALSTMKSTAWLVNVARGALVDTDALVEALKSGSIGGAALDVTDPEPLPDGHPLWQLDNAIITPHIANTWDMAVPELIALIERNVAKFAAGERLEGLVDPVAGY